MFFSIFKCQNERKRWSESLRNGKWSKHPKRVVKLMSAENVTRITTQSMRAY